MYRSLAAVAVFFVALPIATAKPEYLVEAINFGAKDCSFCHQTAAGGEALNDRGNWLVNAKERAGTESVDVAWLAIRERRSQRNAPVVDQGDLTRYQTVEEAAFLNKMPSRAMDYTTNHGEWPAYGGNLGAQKYTPLNQINLETVDDLEIVWEWKSNLDPGPREVEGQRKGPDMFKGTPLMANNMVYVRTRFSAIVAIDPLTGSTIWEYEPDTIKGPSPPMFGFTTRGLSYHADNDDKRVIYTSSDGLLIALNADTGELIEEFGQNGIVNLRTGLRRTLTQRQAAWSNVPSVCDDVIVVGSQTNDGSHWHNARNPDAKSWKENLPVGDVRGFDVKTGKQLWTFVTVPQEGEFGNETWLQDSWKWVGNVNVWSQTSCDTFLGHVYLPLTAPTHHLYGGDRPGHNLFSTSTVAVDLKTGKRVWHFQIVHHDIWDYDLPAPPVVMDFRKDDGTPVKAVAQLTKMGYVFVFDRVTGKPVWEVIEREVPKSDLEGEWTAATQPHPTKPPAYVNQGFTENDVIDLTPELKEAALEQIKNYRLGPLYTPASTRGTLINPGVGGGANWGGGSYDPESQTFFVGARQVPMLLQARMNVPPSERLPRYRVAFLGVNNSNLPIVKPPWSTITAYDMRTGTIKWQVPNGAGPKTHGALRHLELPDLGVLNAAPGLLVTPELIIHGNRAAMGSELRVLEKETGKLVWQHPIKGFATEAPPITYSIGEDQYIVIGIGGAWEPARLIAFRLRNASVE